MKRAIALAGMIASSGCYGLHLPLNTPFNDNNGQEIIIRDNPLLTPKANSTLYEGRYYINYNPAYMRMRVHPDAQKFIFFHELGHIRLGHHGMYIYDKKQAEKDADCYSGEMLRDVYHYTPRQFKNIYGHIEMDFRDSDRAEAMKRCVEKQVIPFTEF
ncbi:MAG: hypothetical protein AABW53_02585 [Nanoarchaeota archaeon]